MAQFFGLFVFASILAGIAFPYYAISLAKYAFAFQAVLVIWAGLTIDWSQFKKIKSHVFPVLIGLFLGYVFFPLIQLFLFGLVIHDQQLLYGLFFVSLAPIAIVVPFFAGEVGGNKEVAFLLMIVSMLLTPLVIPLQLAIFFPDYSIRPLPVALSILLVVSLPLLVSYLVSRYLHGLRAFVSRNLGLLNLITLCPLIYILFGATTGRLHLDFILGKDLGFLLAAVFFQDLGVLLLAGLLLQGVNTRDRRALSVSLGLKNAAMSASILLFYEPRAALPSALVFVAHSIMFSVIPLSKRWISRPPA